MKNGNNNVYGNIGDDFQDKLLERILIIKEKEEKQHNAKVLSFTNKLKENM